MELARIVEYNPWWDTGEVRPELCPIYERQILSKIIGALESRSALVLRGPRRTGKSTVLYQAVRYLLSKKVEPDNILYFSFDAVDGTIQELLDEYSNSILEGALNSKGRLYVFLDEVQKCKNWAEQVKRNYDLYPNVKFILSGSVSFELGAKATESLAGRVIEFVLFPMSFREYLELNGVELPKENATLKSYLVAEKRIFPKFKHYLITGGFPEIAQTKDNREIREYIQSSLARRVIYVDLFQEARIGEPESMMALLRAISEFPGLLMNYENLGSDLGRDRRTISSYVSRLEYAMVIRTVGNIRGSSLASSRKHRRAYPVSPALTFAFKGYDIDDGDMGRVYENAVLNHLDAKFFWRNRSKEVDFITGDQGEIATEVKMGGEGPFHFEQYSRTRAIEKAYVITKNAHGAGHSDSIQYKKVPAWALCAGAKI